MDGRDEPGDDEWRVRCPPNDALSINPSATIMGDQWANRRLWDRPCSPVNNAHPLSEWWWTVDRLQLAAIIALMLAGVILSLAASPPVATRIGLDPFHFFNRHVLFLLPSFIVMIAVSFLSPRQIRRTRADRVRDLSIALIVATLLVGPEVKGSRRWITLLGVNIQASESAKPAFVVIAAWLFAEFGQAAGDAGHVDGAGAAADAGVATGAWSPISARPC